MPLLVSMDESCDDDCAPEPAKQLKSAEIGAEKPVQSAEQAGASTAVTKKPQDSDAWSWLNRGFHAPMDVTETKDSWSLAVDVPGVKPEEVKVEVKNGQLSIRGSRKHNRDETTEENGVKFRRIERSSGSFSRCVALPRDVDQDKIVATQENGVLHVTMPKIANANQPKMIPIAGAAKPSTDQAQAPAASTTAPAN